jgi:hypothetical protein
MLSRMLTRFILFCLFLLTCVAGIGCYYPGWHHWR